MKRIAFLPVGGTICTALREQGDLAVHERAAFWLTEHYELSDSPFVGEVSFLTAENLGILSENMTVAQWNRIRESFSALTSTPCDGVIVAHGTDTLAYSAALFSLLWQSTQVPVVFVAANRPLASSASNGHRNFRAAVECICLGLGAGVYVCYENPSDGILYLHLASRLRQCPSYSEDFFSVGRLALPSAWEERREAIGAWNQRFPLKKAPFLPPQLPLLPCVGLITPYVGMDYAHLPLDSQRALLHLAYHSGTVCVEGQESSVLTLLSRCEEQGVALYCSPARRDGQVYESVRKLCRHGASLHFLYGTTAECAYAKLLVAYSLLPAEKRQSFLQEDVNYEFFA